MEERSLEEAEEPELEPEERTMTVLKLIEGLGLNDAGIKVIKDIDLSDQQRATSRQGITRMWIFCDEILKKKGSLSTRVLRLVSFPFSRTCTSPLILLVIGDDDPGDTSTESEEMPPP